MEPKSKGSDNAFLTPRQRELLDFLRSFVAANGYPPTVRQIGVALGLSSTQTVHAHLARLERKGYVHLRHAHRAIQVLADHDEAINSVLQGRTGTDSDGDEHVNRSSQAQMPPPQRIT